MSRFEGKPLAIKEGCKLSVQGQVVNAEGPKGKLSFTVPTGVVVEKLENDIKFDLPKIGRKSNKASALVGLSYHLVKNMTIGVVEGFVKKLEINGVGYRWSVAGKELKLQAGFSYDVIYPIPSDITITTKDNILTVEGIDKQRVGEVADEIKRYRPVEPYKGKGIKFVGEYVVRKVGKSGK